MPKIQRDCLELLKLSRSALSGLLLHLEYSHHLTYVLPPDVTEEQHLEACISDAHDVMAAIEAILPRR